jgi:hypothetical protein
MGMGALVAALLAATVQMPIAVGNALTLPAQRHLVRVDPGDGRGAIEMLAIQQDGADGHGLGWFRSDDEGQTFQYVGPIQNDWSERDEPDAIVVGNDIALVFSYESNTLAASDRHDVYFQWWRYQPASRTFAAGPVLKIFDADSTNAYSRAELARDGAGRLWVHAFRMEPDGSTSTAFVAVSTDGGNSFSQLPALDQLPNRGGGRLLWLGSELLFVYGLHDGFIPARMRVHRDSDAPGTWGPVQQAFSSGEGIYHGAALSAVADGHGGMHLVYKNENDERLYYRHFDGAQFGAATLIDDSSDWALQPAITAVGDDLYVFYNHVFTGNVNYDWRYRRLHAGSFSAPVVLDATQNWKGYPASVDVLPSTVAQIPCIFGRVPAGQDAGFEVTVYAPDQTVGGVVDAGVPDAGVPDAGVPDAGSGGGTDGGTASVRFADDFNRSGALGSNWSIASGAWTDNGTAATGTASQSFAFWVGNPAANDSASVTISTPIRNTYTGVVVRGATGAPAATHYAGYVDPGGAVHIARRNGGTYTFLADGPAFPSGSHVLQLTATGSGPVVLSLAIDGAQVLAFTDNSSSAIGAAGKAGMVDYSGAGQPIDRFAVTTTAVSNPDAGTPDAGVPDAGTVDAGTPDAGTPDAGVDAGVPDAGAPDAGTDAGVLFTDEFNRTGALGSNWTIAGGTWSDNGSAATGTAAQSFAFWIGSPATNDTASITISTPILNTYTGVIVRGTSGSPAANHYAAYVDPTGLVHIARRNASSYTFLADGPAFPSGSHVLSLTATGSNPVVLSVKIDGAQVLSFSDSSSSALTAAGKAGMVDYNGAGQPIDRFVVTDPPAGSGGTGGGTPDAGTPDAGVSGTQLTLAPVYTDTSKIFMAVDSAGTAYSVSLSDQTTVLASSDARSWSSRGRHPSGAAFFLMSPLASGALLADVIHDGSHHLARSTDHGANWTDVLDFNGYRMLTPHNVAELDGAVFVLEYQDFTESATTIRLWRSLDDGQTWSVRHSWTTHRHGHGLIADPAHHALWALFGDTDAQSGTERTTDAGGTFTLMLSGQPGDVVDGFALSDGSILFGQDISYLPPTPHIARLTSSGGYSELASLPGPSYGAHAIRSGGYLVSAEREPGGDIYPAGEISAHVFASLDGTHWADLLDYPWANSNDIVRADVYFELPSGLLVLELYNASGFGPQGYQLLQVGRR